MLRLVLLAIVVVVCASGCFLLRPQLVQLAPAEVQDIQARHGPLTEENRSEWAKAAGELLGEDVTAVETRKDGVVVAVLGPPAQAMGKDFVDSVVTGVADRPGKSGLVIALTLGMAAMLASFQRRRALLARAPDAGAETSRAPPLVPLPTSAGATHGN